MASCTNRRDRGNLGAALPKPSATSVHSRFITLPCVGKQSRSSTSAPRKSSAAFRSRRRLQTYPHALPGYKFASAHGWLHRQIAKWRQRADRMRSAERMLWVCFSVPLPTRGRSLWRPRPLPNRSRGSRESESPAASWHQLGDFRQQIVILGTG